MNIQTVADTLRNTISDKEQLAAHYREVAANNPGKYFNLALAIFVQDHVDGLRRVLQDLEQFEGQKTGVDNA